MTLEGERLVLGVQDHAIGFGELTEVFHVVYVIQIECVQDALDDFEEAHDVWDERWLSSNREPPVVAGLFQCTKTLLH